MAMILTSNGAMQIASEVMRLRESVKTFKAAGMDASMQAALARQVKRENDVVRYASKAERELADAKAKGETCAPIVQDILKTVARTHTGRLAKGL